MSNPRSILAITVLVVVLALLVWVGAGRAERGDGSGMSHYPPPPPERCSDIFRDVYRCGPGGIILAETTKGKITPKKTIPESVEWPE